MKKIYSLKKSRKILRSFYVLFSRRKNRLSAEFKETFEPLLRSLDQAVVSRNKKEASLLAHQVEEAGKLPLKKSWMEAFRELFFALGFAICVAYIIRQFWFELYEVPTGSMRPSIQEQDRLIVSKTTFGLRDGFFIKKPFFFNLDQIIRNGMIVFTVRGMDVKDNKALYFGFIPGMKQLVKRCIARPGDTLYFYGGRIYGLDSKGEPILELSDEEILAKNNLDHITHIPYITFEGEALHQERMSEGYYTKTIVRQMGTPVARLESQRNGWIRGEFHDGKEWQQESLDLLKEPHSSPVSFSDLWGLRNYAMTRLLSHDETRTLYQKEFPKEVSAILELNHTPNVTYPRPEIQRTDHGDFAPTVSSLTTLVPITEKQMARLNKAMSTARFYVRSGSAYRYTESGKRPQPESFDAKLPGVPDGLYEFYKGTAYRIYFGGIRRALLPSHPLYDMKHTRELFNLGTSFNRLFDPLAKNQPFMPQRFAYWKEGSLFVLDAPFLEKGEQETNSFIEKEIQRQEQSGRLAPYIAFIDRGPPLKEDGSLDRTFIENFGLKVPEDAVIALGDNYAGSSDSRAFGSVPLENLRGSPTLIFWPPGSRLGWLAQPFYPSFTTANFVVWSLAFVIGGICVIYTQRKKRRSIFKD